MPISSHKSRPRRSTLRYRMLRKRRRPRKPRLHSSKKRRGSSRSWKVTRQWNSKTSLRPSRSKKLCEIKSWPIWTRGQLSCKLKKRRLQPQRRLPLPQQALPQRLRSRLPRSSLLSPWPQRSSKLQRWPPLSLSKHLSLSKRWRRMFQRLRHSSELSSRSRKPKMPRSSRHKKRSSSRQKRFARRSSMILKRGGWRPRQRPRRQRPLLQG
mmetsp:Transcript_14889/g.26086  ORF Transcript_14889/g.26086 Transcript_14889/m.26086 type:complete len:210 (-) Transcript_14889:124-753(-)